MRTSFYIGKHRVFLGMAIALAVQSADTSHQVLAQPTGDKSIKAIHLLEVPGDAPASRMSTAVSADDGYYLAGPTWTKEKENELAHWLWRVDAQGKKLWEKRLPPSRQNSVATPIALLPPATKEKNSSGPSGVRIVVKWLMDTGLLTISPDGSFSPSVSLGRLGDPHGAISFGDDILIFGSSVVGNLESFAWVVRVDGHGKILWKREFDLTNAGEPKKEPRKKLPPGRLRQDILYAAVVLNDGSIALAGQTGETNKFGQGATKLCLIRLQGDGQKLGSAFIESANVFPASSDLIAATPNGVIVTYSTSQLPPIAGAPANFPPGFGAQMARFDLDLKKLGDSKLPQAGMPGSVTIKGPAPYVSVSAAFGELVIQASAEDGAKQWQAKVSTPESMVLPVGTFRSAKNTVVICNYHRHPRSIQGTLVDFPQQAMIVVVDEPTDPGSK